MRFRKNRVRISCDAFILGVTTKDITYSQGKKKESLQNHILIITVLQY